MKKYLAKFTTKQNRNVVTMYVFASSINEAISEIQDSFDLSEIRLLKEF